MPKTEIHSLATDNRYDELKALNIGIHQLTAEFFDRVLLHDPAGNKPEYHLFLTVDGKPVAGTSLLRHTLQWFGNDIPAGEIGLVGTLENYRLKGYSGRLMETCLESMRDERILLSFVWGIPGYYERYHYYYAFPHVWTPYVSFDKARAEKWDSSGTIREAEISDHWWIQKLYRAYNLDVTGCQVRDEHQWKWYFTVSDGSHSNIKHGWYVTQDPAGGYAFVTEGKSDDTLIVREIASPSPSSLKNYILGFFDAYPCVTRLDFHHHPDLPVGKWLFQWGAEIRSVEDIWHGSWAGMVRIMDVAALLKGMCHKFFDRLSRSRYFNLTETIPIHSEIGSAVIIIRNGSVEIERTDSPDGIFIPAYALTPMMTGYRGFTRFRSELRDIPVHTADILDVLFPRDIVYMYDMIYINEWLR